MYRGKIIPRGKSTLVLPSKSSKASITGSNCSKRINCVPEQSFRTFIKIQIYLVPKKTKLQCLAPNKIFTRYLKKQKNTTHYEKEKNQSIKTNSKLKPVLIKEDDCYNCISYVQNVMSMYGKTNTVL